MEREREFLSMTEHIRFAKISSIFFFFFFFFFFYLFILFIYLYIFLKTLDFFRYFS